MKLSLPARALVALSVVSALAAAIGIYVVDGVTSTVTPAQWAIAAIVSALLLSSWIWPMLIFRANESEALHLDEGLLVVLIVLVPNPVSLLAFATALISTQLVRRRQLMKAAFNIGQGVAAAGAGMLVAGAVAPRSTEAGAAQIGAALVGAIVYVALNSGMVASIMVATGATWRSSLLDGASARLALTAAGLISGTLLAMASTDQPWAIGLAIPVVLGMRQILSRQFEAHHDRTRMRGLFNVAMEANQNLRQEAVIRSILKAAHEELRCSEASLSANEPGPADGAMSVQVGIGDETQWLVVSGRPRGEPFDQADRILLDAMAAIARSALTNAELYRQVRFERGRLASITLSMGEGVCALDRDGNLTFVNPAAADLISLPTIGTSVADALPNDTLRAPGFLVAAAVEAMRTGGVIHADDAFFPYRLGGTVPVAYTAAAVKQNDEVIGAVISFRDISERKRLEEQMAYDALYDSLTGLANRRLLVERLEQALERSRQSGQVHALIFVDVDRFKAINDSLGHGTGDDLLIAVGARMRETLQAHDLLARFGGDEFVILLEDVSGTDEAVNAARRVCSAVEQPLVLSDGYEVVASLSVGIALTEPGCTADDILRDADVAMYKAKGQGGTYRVFERRLMGTRSSERIDLEAALRKALERQELEVYYQPLISVDDSRVVGAEALVRWNHPTEGLVMPSRFIPLAEETGLILPLGQYVLDHACSLIRSIGDRRQIDLPVSVNLSPRQFQHSSLLSEVASALDRAGLASDLLLFEITESMVMDDLQCATRIMKNLNRLGIRLAIDDFGTGHSSLRYLKQFPIHEVKVDRTFVKGLGGDPIDSAIVRSVVDLADAMKITAVAEGVETREQLAALKMLGCHVAQGYYFAKPLSADELDSYLEAHVTTKAEPTNSIVDLRVC